MSHRLHRRPDPRRLGDRLRHLIDVAEEPPRGFSAAVPVRRREILEEQRLIQEVAADLESGEDLDPGGIELVRELLTRGDSPVYTPSPEGSLHEALCEARAALHLR